MMRLIDADDLKDFFFSETSGTKEVIHDLMATHGLDYANDVNEESVETFAIELLKSVINVIDTQPTAYDVDAVVKQLEELTEEECTLHECGIRSECCKPCIAKKAIEIVEGGGVDGN